MAKVLGFNQAIADEQAKLKKQQQRAASHKRNSRHIHLTRDTSPLTHRMVL